MTKERPILFSAPMLRAVLEGSKRQTHGEQLSLALATPDDLAQFCIPHHGKHIVYGDVSRRMGQLRRQGRWVELAELVDVAAELYKAPEWRRIFAEWRARETKRMEVAA